MAKIAKYAGLAGMLMLSTACVSLDQEDALERFDAPASWATISDELSGSVAPVTPDWLADMGDGDVTQIVSAAMENNNNLAASASSVKAAVENARITRAGLLPSITGSLGASRRRGNGGVQQVGDDFVAVPPGNYSNTTNLSLNASWEADIWGRLTDQTRSAYLQASAQDLDFAAAKLSIAGSAAQSWYGLAAARLQRQLSERDVETGEANLRIIERRYDRGISSSLDVRLARSSLASSRATLISRQQAEQEAARALEVLIGEYPSGQLANLSGLPSLEPMMDDKGAMIGVGDPAGLLFRRPDVLAAEARLRANRLDVYAARKQFLPALQVSLSGQWGDTTIQDLFDIDQVAGSLAASLVQPLFQGGRLKAAAAARRHQLESSVYSYAQTVLEAYQDVENALAAERFLAARLEALELAYDEAVASEDLTSRQYVNGTADIFNLINAQQRRISAESAYISAAQARLANRINLYLALGAPFEVPGDEQYTAEEADNALTALTSGQEGDQS